MMYRDDLNVLSKTKQKINDLLENIYGFSKTKQTVPELLSNKKVEFKFFLMSRTFSMVEK